jgi:hypothetical protein
MSKTRPIAISQPLAALWFWALSISFAAAQCPSAPYNSPTRTFAPIAPRPGTATLANPLLAGAAPSVLTVVAFGDAVVLGNALNTALSALVL